MKLTRILIVISLAATLPSPAKATPTHPLLTTADLEAAVSALPLQKTPDRVNTLQTRLVLLDAARDPGLERPALRQALILISLARSIRLTSEPARAEQHLVAEI